MRQLRVIPHSNDDVNEETRQKIIEASIQHMRAFGSERLTMSDVAKLAGVARATIYNYFGTKEELIRAAEYSLEGIFFGGLEKEVAKFTELDDRIATIAIFIRKSWTDREHTPWYGFLSPMDEATLVAADAANHSRLMIDFIKPYVVAAQKSGEMRKDLDVDRTSDWLSRLILSFALQPADPKMDDPMEIWRFFKEHLMQGIGSGGTRKRKKTTVRKKSTTKD